MDSEVRKMDMQTTQEVGTIENNPIRLKPEVTQAMCKALDMHLAALISIFHQYYKHHWLAKGPQFRELHLFFKDKYEQVQIDFDRVAERITMLGGVPTSSMTGQEQKSFIVSENEGDHPVRDFLSKDLEDEGMLAERLRESCEQAVALKDFGTEYMLKKILFHCEERAHELDHFLAGDSLESGSKAPNVKVRH